MTTEMSEEHMKAFLNNVKDGEKNECSLVLRESATCNTDYPVNEEFVSQFRIPHKRDAFILFSSQRSPDVTSENELQQPHQLYLPQKRMPVEVITIEDSDSDSQEIEFGQTSNRRVSTGELDYFKRNVSEISRNDEHTQNGYSQKQLQSEGISFQKLQHNSLQLSLSRKEETDEFSSARSVASSVSSDCESLYNETPLHDVERKVCKFCKQTFGFDHGLKRHLLFHCPVKKKYKYLCTICGKTFSGDGVFGHLTMVHKVKQMACKKGLVVKLSVTDNTKSEAFRKSKVKHTCKFCSKTFSNINGLKIHEKQVCESRNSWRDENNVPSFACEMCKTEFKEKENLKEHIIKCKSIKPVNSVETKSRKFQCFYCKRIFNWKCNLKQHQKICKNHQGLGPKKQNRAANFRCEFCGKAFVSQKVCVHHKRYFCNYTNSKQFPCENCGKRYLKFSYFIKHKRYCTKRNNVPLLNNENSEMIHIENNIQKALNKCLFTCNVCNKQFPDVSTLIDHIQKHLEVEGDV